MTDGLPPDVEQALRALIVKIPNFPQAPIVFNDITPILERDPIAFRALVHHMGEPHRTTPPDIIVCIESFGYLFGAPLALDFGCRIVLARRAGKLPRSTLHQEYGMGYDHARRMEIHVGAIEPGDRVLIVDDVLATGGTALAAVNLIDQAGGRVIGASFAVELAWLPGARRLEERAVAVYSALLL